MIICQLSIAPFSDDVHLQKYVKKAIQVIKDHHVPYEINDMATIIEVDSLDTLFSIIKKAHESVMNDPVVRVITEIKIDDRRDKTVHLGDKKKAVQ